MDRYLITTADERTWKFDCPVLFLGEWCRRYNRKQIWESMDAVVAEPFGLKVGQKERDLAYVKSLSGQLLQELTDALNEFHNTHHSLRYWLIVLGHWLQRYVEVAFNRYFTLEQALNAYQVSGTTILDSGAYSLAASDSVNMIWAWNDDLWNHVFCSRILSYWGYRKTEPHPKPLEEHCFHLPKSLKSPRRKGAKSVLADAARKILPGLSRPTDAFIISSFLPLAEEIKLQLSLGQCPQLWRSPKLKNVALDPEKRRRFSIDSKYHQGFERFIRDHLGEIIPICFLEGYDQLVQQVGSLPWPSKPKFIFTSNNSDTDEIFKAWVGLKIEEGVPYFAGQHGANFGTHVQMGSEIRPDRAASDRFFTWGWTNGDPRNIPALVFTRAGYKRRLNNKLRDGGLLLIEHHLLHRFGPEDYDFQYGIYQEEQFRFVAALPESVQQLLTVRLFGGYSHLPWFDYQRWRDHSPGTRIEHGVAPIRDLISGSRLVVHSYDSTGLLETLSLNIPTICFWQGGLTHLVPSAKRFYELLRSAGIYQDTPEKAAAMAALHWDQINDWWGSQKVQVARAEFCEQFARYEERPIRKLKRLLTEHANQVGGRVS